MIFRLSLDFKESLFFIEEVQEEPIMKSMSNPLSVSRDKSQELLLILANRIIFPIFVELTYIH